MAAAFGFLLVLALFASLLRIGRTADRHLADPVLHRLDVELERDETSLGRLVRDMPTGGRPEVCANDGGPDDAGELCEIRLTHALTTHAIDRETYQCWMSELAQHANRAGDVR